MKKIEKIVEKAVPPMLWLAFATLMFLAGFITYLSISRKTEAHALTIFLFIVFDLCIALFIFMMLTKYKKFISAAKEEQESDPEYGEFLRKTRIFENILYIIMVITGLNEVVHGRTSGWIIVALGGSNLLVKLIKKLVVKRLKKVGK